MTFDLRSRSILYSLVNASTYNLDVATSNLGVFHPNQIFMCLDPQGEVGAVKPV